MSVLVIVDEFDCDNVAVVFFFFLLLSGEVCEPAFRKQEAETLSPSDHRSDNSSSSHRTNQFLVGVFSSKGM